MGMDIDMDMDIEVPLILGGPEDGTLQPLPSGLQKLPDGQVTLVE